MKEDEITISPCCVGDDLHYDKENDSFVRDANVDDVQEATNSDHENVDQQNLTSDSNHSSNSNNDNGSDHDDKKQDVDDCQ